MDIDFCNALLPFLLLPCPVMCTFGLFSWLRCFPMALKVVSNSNTLLAPGVTLLVDYRNIKDIQKHLILIEFHHILLKLFSD